MSSHLLLEREREREKCSVSVFGRLKKKLNMATQGNTEFVCSNKVNIYLVLKLSECFKFSPISFFTTKMSTWFEWVEHKEDSELCVDFLI